MKRRMGNYQNHIKLSSNYREKKRKKKTRNGILKSSKEPQLPTDLTIKHKKSQTSYNRRHTQRRTENGRICR
jgi:hypothetical protein